MSIELKNLKKAYKDKMVVDHLSLEIDNGEFFALLGSNGAGKTTTIKMLSCMLIPTEGDAFLLGDSIITSPEAVKQNINVSPQETAVAPNLTVRENLEFIARIYGSGKEKARKMSHEMMMEFSLLDKAKTKAKTLSGGWQRRLSIAMALISKPKILFLDEPTLGLDVRARRELWKVLETLKGKVTVVLTTHYLDEAEALADRIGIMHQGRLQALGTASELKKQHSMKSLEDIFLILTEEGVK
ncbi:ABC transporter ATP-binding protein [Cytobacillus praedii]|uniref:ABC transporter ATP-binding protein n=1 Tax=Cytobacillus solani TaxID=1637975 RepID=A0A0Q3QST4_9BACI|nr:ABC transporter ATP-binding protein [Cytobacillus solani]KOP79903.1 ABC transporter ATP-binding protein [Bacillus sp. FJAT-21945]KQL21217.1 ABC transporter ATP-binding protein [Cytobacillus solani]USK54522.1 ABC transporter ATP-binding protein [Cytobacillus solani]